MMARHDLCSVLSLLIKDEETMRRNKDLFFYTLYTISLRQKNILNNRARKLSQTMNCDQRDNRTDNDN